MRNGTGELNMKCNAAVIHGVGPDWSVEEIEVDEPNLGEVLVHWTHAGLCHSDERLLPKLGTFSEYSCVAELDELITNTDSLDDINVGYQAMRDGEHIRGVVVHAS